MFRLTREILDLPKGDYIEAVITGERRVGKSTFAILLAAEILRNSRPQRHFTRDQSIEYVINNLIVNTIEGFIEKTKPYAAKKSIDDRLELLIIDDAGMEFFGDVRNEDRKLYIAFHKLYDGVGTAVKFLIFTCLDISELFSFIKKNERTRLINVVRAGGPDRRMRQAVYYKRWKLILSGKIMGTGEYAMRFDIPPYSISEEIMDKYYNPIRAEFLVRSVEETLEARARQKEIEEYKRKRRRVRSLEMTLKEAKLKKKIKDMEEGKDD